MSDAIETGARRKIRSLAKPRSYAIGKHRKIDRTKDEHQFGRRTDKAPEIETLAPPPDVETIEDNPTVGKKAGGETTAADTAATRELKLGRVKTKASVSTAPEEDIARATAGKGKATGAAELELGRFAGRVRNDVPSDRAGAEKSKPADMDGVVGPKRQRIDSSKAEAIRKEGTPELQIGTLRDTSEDAIPSRPAMKRRRRKTEQGGRLFTFTVLSALLVALTVVTFFLMTRHDVVGDPLIADPAFAADLDGWTRAGSVAADPDEPAHLTLESADADEQTFLTRDIALPPDTSLVELRARVQGEDVRPGPEIWDGARIYFARLDRGGQPIWTDDHVLFNLNGTTDVRNYWKTFRVSPPGGEARLGIELKASTGKLSVTHLELSVVEYRLAFLAAVGALLLCWTGLVLYVGIRTFSGIESGRIKLWLGIISAIAVVALMLPGNIHDFSTAQIAAKFGITDVDVDAVGHGVVFALLAFLVRLGRTAEPIWLHAGAWALIAIGSEVLQLFTFERDPSIHDLLVDCVGIIVGLTLAEMFCRMRRLSAA